MYFGCGAMLSRRNVLSLRCLLACFLIRFTLRPWRWWRTSLRNVSELLSHYTASHPRRQLNLRIFIPRQHVISPTKLTIEWRALLTGILVGLGFRLRLGNWLPWFRFIAHFLSPSMQIRDSTSHSRYSDWLRAERPRSRGSSPGRIKNFLFSMSSRPTLGPIQPSI
jgi:hypothetical protein